MWFSGAPVRTLLPCASVGDDIHAARYAERKRLIGYSLVFLPIRESKGGIASLAVPGGQGADLQGRGVDGDDQIFVLRFGLPRRQLQGRGARRRRVRVGGREVSRDVALARQEQRRRRGLAVARNGRDEHLLVLWQVRINLLAVGHELLLFRARVD